MPDSVYVEGVDNEATNGKSYVMPEVINHIPIYTHFKNDRAFQKLAPSLIHAVDDKTCELVYSWLL
jgi:hypothetical protein